MVVGLVAVVSATGGGAWSGFARAGNSQLVAVVGSEVKLAPRGEIGNAMFGVAARLSADGTTALIGGSYDDHYRGAAWVFVRDGATWVQQAKLAPRGEIGGGAFGFGLALSADGNVAVVGAPDDNQRGAVWVFRRIGSDWRQWGGKLTGAGESGAGEFGYSVALSGSGEAMLVGGPLDRPIRINTGLSGHGALWAFRATPQGWVQQGAKIAARDETPYSEVGLAVTISESGSTALVGSFGPGDGRGAAWVFSQTRSGWVQEGGELVARDEIGQGLFGISVALSADGQTALIGGADDDHIDGAGWVFTRAGGRWVQRAKLIANDAIGHAGLGISVALSADGNTALVGGWNDNHERGAAWVFKNVRAGWVQSQKIIATHQVISRNGLGNFGDRVALSANATTGLIGGYQDNGGRGAAWVVQLSAPTSCPPGAGRARLCA